MKEAERNTLPVVLSDWDHLKSGEYMKAMEETGYDILYAPIYPLWHIFTNKPKLF